MALFDTIGMIFERSGLKSFLADGGWKTLIMFAIVGVLVYLAIVKKFEPLLLLPIAFGMLLTNIPGANLFHMDLFLENQINIQQIVTEGGMLDFLYLGVKLGIYPPLIFLGVGAMTDFSPLIANPKTLFLGAAAQFGVFVAFIGALLLGFTVPEAASIGIIGGADGPTAILVTKTLAPALLGAIAIAAYSYMALVPFIQPPIMKLCTTKKERAVKMEQLRPVSKTEQILFPVVVTVVVCLILPEATSLIGMLMLGNLFRVCGVVDRLSKTAQNELTQLDTDIQSSKENLQVLLGWSYDANPEIGELPEVDISRIDAMDPAADLEQAKENNYTLQINKRQLENARDQTTKDSLTSTIANNEKQIGASLSSAYKDVLSSELAYEQAQAELSLQEKNTQIAQAQLAAGMITQKEYQDQENTLTNSQLAVQTAAMDLLEDMETYDWSVRGLAAAE